MVLLPQRCRVVRYNSRVPRPHEDIAAFCCAWCPTAHTADSLVRGMNVNKSCPLAVLGGQIECTVMIFHLAVEPTSTVNTRDQKSAAWSVVGRADALCSSSGIYGVRQSHLQ